VSRRDPVTQAALTEWLAAHGDWSVENSHLVARWSLPFATSARLMVDLAALADEWDHHPDVTVRYGSLTVELWTHDRSAVTQLDLEVAARISDLVAAA